MNTHETYVSLEVAKLLKEAGFDWETREYYKFTDEGYRFRWNALPVNWNKKVAALIAEKHGLSEGYSAPTLSVVQKWLREVKGYSIYPTFGGYKIYVLDANDSAGFSKTYVLNSILTYEKAQEAGIKKVLKLILEKGE